MLNSPVRVGEMDESYPESVISEGRIGINPFPGLRPFTMEECYLFFGREGQVDDILLKLSSHRSVAVMGYSGSGKSSLMFCGVLPVLYGGFVTQTGPFWSIVHSRPGSSPINNLTNSILDGLIHSKKIEEEDKHIHRAIINSILRSGPYGLIEIAHYIQKDEGENVFFLIDQFEELFRYADGGNEDSANEATAYVNLILTAVQQQEVPIYVALSMRSDFVGDCASYHGLSEMINASNYLVPQMTREQKRMAIEGPVTVSGGKITPRLLKRLLNDIGDDQDQLPILQHAMMRTWDYWVTNHDPGEPLDLRHYNAIGKISQALSLHANEAFEELNTRQKEIAEILFKALTEKGQDQGMRRPVKVGLVSELADAQENEVINVVDNFRRPGRSFLMPGSSVVLDAETVIELSHESLMRIWTRLSVWVNEESESALMYKRVSDAAAMYQIGRTSLWRPPDLQLALNWQKKQRPTRIWAQRYDIAFERAIVFLDTSRITYEAELKNQEMLQRRMLRRARITNIVLAVFLLIAIAFFFYGLINKIAADQRLVEANAQKENALKASREANEQRVLAEKKTQEVISKQSEIEQQRDQLATINDQLKIAFQKADSLRIQADKNFAEAKIQRDSARLERDKATREFTRAENNFNVSNARLMLSIAQSLEAKSEGIDDKDLAGSTAMQGYIFHTKFGGKKYDPYVFRGLYYALTKLSGANYNSVKMPGNFKSKMFALAVSQKGSAFYTSGNDGRIFSGDFITQKADKIINEKEFPNRVLALSKDEKYLVNGSDSTYMEIFNLADPGKKPMIVNGHSGFVTDIKFMPDNSGFISSSVDKTLRLTNQVTGQSKKILSLPFDIKSIDISSNGKLLAAASASGKLILVDLKDFSFKEIKDEAPNRILSVTFHPSRPVVAYGVEVVGERARGTVKLMNINTQKVEKELSGHKAGISDLEFSPDGLLLASAGLDRKLQMWVVDHVEDLPIVMDNNNGYVWKLSFSKGSDYLIASFNDGEVRVWPTDPKMLAVQVCPKLSRNMTPEEWEIYVGNNVGYESTCKSLLIKSF